LILPTQCGHGEKNREEAAERAVKEAVDKAEKEAAERAAKEESGNGGGKLRVKMKKVHVIT
jgi:hypothetical protein